MASIVTLLTDFGSTDSYVAEMKGVLLRTVPSACLVDVTHAIAPGDVRAAEYVLRRTWKQFPPGTVHLAVVDPGVGTARRALAVSGADHLFVAPDNGLLTPVLDGARVVELPVPEDAAPTFHGRDVFAPAAARLAAGEPLERLGTPVREAQRLDAPRPVRRDDDVAGEVVYIDRFGNLITNIPGAWCGPGTVSVNAIAAATVVRTFGDVPSGSLLAYIGSDGTLEVGARNGSAADVLRAGVGAAVTWEKGRTENADGRPLIADR